MRTLAEQADQIYEQAMTLQARSNQLVLKAMEMYQVSERKARREQDDKLINRTQAVELLWFDTRKSLKTWEKRVAPLGYLEFTNHKILRSEVLRFIDDFHDGTIHKKLNAL